MVLTLADGTVKSIDLTRFVYSVASTPTISMQITDRVMTATIVDGSVTMAKLDSAIQTEFRHYMLDAQAARDAALQYQKYAKHAVPSVGTLPMNTSYWQVSAQGTNTASADTIGVVKPDGETITVDSAGTISAKKATESTLGIVSGGSIYSMNSCLSSKTPVYGNIFH